MRDTHAWVRCGNCGELIVADLDRSSLGSLAWEYAEHMKAHHSGTNWHQPVGGIVDESALLRADIAGVGGHRGASQSLKPTGQASRHAYGFQSSR